MAHEHDAVAHTHASAEDEYRSTPPGAGHEHTDANVWIIAKFGFWLILSAIVIHFGLGGMFRLFYEQREETTEPEFPLAADQDLRLPSGPRLQQFPANEIHDFRVREDEVLRNYGWIDRNAGTVHIPIDEAKRLLLERGLASRAPAAAASTGTGSASETPGYMPADSSSGRTLERRRQ